MPYLKAKAHAAYTERRQQAVAAALWSDDATADPTAQRPTLASRSPSGNDSEASRGAVGLSSNDPWSAEGTSLEAFSDPSGALSLNRRSSPAWHRLTAWLQRLLRRYSPLAQGTGGMGSGEGSNTSTVLSRLNRLRGALSSAGLAAYPWIHAQYEGLLFMYQLLYMLDASPFYLPSLQILSLRVRRATPEELSQAHSQVSEGNSTVLCQKCLCLWYDLELGLIGHSAV